MLTRTDRRRFPVLLAVIAALAMAMLFSPVQAQEGSAPDQPTGLEATATHGQVVLTWDDPQDDSITGYVILRRVRVNNTGGDFDVLVSDTGTAALTYTDDTVAASLTYTYRIKAINEHGVSERSRWFHVDTPAAPEPEEEQAAEPPDKPRGLEATATHGQVVLTWDDPQDDTITGYVILRRVRVNDTGGDFDVLVADTGTAALTYTDNTVAASLTYTYRIKAINEHGVSERSRWFHVDTPAAPEPEEEQAAEPPDQPTGLDATATHDSVTLTWDDPGDDSITGYVILRRIPAVDPQGHFNELVSNTGTDATTYTDDTVSAETRYTYRIKAINEHGVSERSRWFHINVPAAPEAAEGDEQDGEGGGGSGGPGKRANVSEGGTDCSGDTATTCEVDVGGSVTGNIGFVGDGDYFRVDLEAGTRYQIDLEGADTGRGTLADPALVLYDESDSYLLGDDNNGVGDNARMIYTPTTAGTYYLFVEDSLESVTGTYTLSVIVLGANGNSEADTDFPETTATTGRVEVGASATGNLSTVTDVDWFKVVLAADKTYQIDMKGVDGGGGTMGDPYLHDIRDSSGTGISNTGNDDVDADNDIYDSQITFTPTTAGAYYLVAAGASDSGTYTLSVSEVLPCTLNEGDIWCGVVDVEEVRSTANVLTGHGFVGITGRETGGLAGHPDDTMFSVGDNDYTIQGIYVGTGTNNEGALFLLLTANLSDDDEGILVLAFDGVTTLRPLDDATKLSTGLYHWSTVLDWSSTTEVTVRLQTPSDDADDPPVVLPTLSIGNASGAEGSITLFPLTLSAAASGDVTVTCTASFESGDTAAAADLAALVSPATIQAGSTTGQCATVFAQDTIDENNETFTVTLSGVSSNAQLAADPTAKGTILDDDDPPVDDSETEEDDLPADTSTTGTVEVGGAAATSIIREPVKETVTWTIIDAEGDEVEKEGTVYDFDTDWFAVDLKAGRTYRIDMKGENADTDNDLTLRLPEIHAIYDADSNYLPNTSSRGATDDANSSHHLARVEFTPEDDGTYYIAATGEAHEWGSYELRVIDITQDDDEHPADRSTTEHAPIGTSVTGKIDFSGDVDWFKLNIDEKTRYQIDLEGQETDSGSLRDPLLLGVYDADGNYISGTRNDDGGEVFNARISRTLKVGIYYVAVGAFGNGEGTYTLTVTY